MKTAALVLERDDESVDLPPHRDVRRRNRRLNLTDAIDQNLQVVKTAKRVLMALQHLDVGRRLEPGGFERDFQRVPEFLQGDADVMQPLLQIDGAGGVE